MSTIILQNVATLEVRQVRVGALLVNGITVVNATLETLPALRTLLCEGAMPVGSVEFVRAAMKQASIKEPPFICYPQGLAAHMRRPIIASTIGQMGLLCERSFVKPVATKLFTGFVFDPSQPGDLPSEHDNDQRRTLCSLPADTPVWLSPPVEWLCEWRYYIDGGILGKARYDDGPEDAPQPDHDFVFECIDQCGLKHPYALDIGVLSDGQSAVVELNDAWALGLYNHALSPAGYLRFLLRRWASITQEAVSV